MQTTQITLNGKPVTEIKVYWDSQDMVNEGWAYTVYGDECVLASGSVDLAQDASLDDAIDEALLEVGVSGFLSHDDFGRIDDDGGYACWDAIAEEIDNAIRQSKERIGGVK